MPYGHQGAEVCVFAAGGCGHVVSIYHNTNNAYTVQYSINACTVQYAECTCSYHCVM